MEATTAPSLPRLNEPAPDFKAVTTQGELTLSQFKGKWVVLFSHPADFTPVCTSEFVGLARAAEDGRALGRTVRAALDGLLKFCARAIREQRDCLSLRTQALQRHCEGLEAKAGKTKAQIGSLGKACASHTAKIGGLEAENEGLRVQVGQMAEALRRSVPVTGGVRR